MPSDDTDMGIGDGPTLLTTTSISLSSTSRSLCCSTFWEISIEHDGVWLTVLTFFTPLFFVYRSFRYEQALLTGSPFWVNQGTRVSSGVAGVWGTVGPLTVLKSVSTS